MRKKNLELRYHSAEVYNHVKLSVPKRKRKKKSNSIEKLENEIIYLSVAVLIILFFFLKILSII